MDKSHAYTNKKSYQLSIEQSKIFSSSWKYEILIDVTKF